ncbi:MAG TPA: DNA polymerase III subunit beta [Candidatus Paceibacterota bacterium]|nr:DNA polymerase III subunit beta [Verrucomicrobiota bacterium]HRY51633.1 DNA polymerase III subunit beta [Candidatus Paceibacterota bacterium]
MKLTIAKEQIINGLQAVQNIVGTRSTLPALSNVLLRAGDSALDLTATDLDVTISARVEAGVQDAGVTTVPVKRLFGIVRELPVQEIEIESDDRHGLIVRAGGCYYRIHGLAPEEFPPLPQIAEDKRILLPQSKVKSMLRKTSYAISNDEARYVLNGIFFSIKEHKVTMVATDGRRLALAEEDVDVPINSQSEFIVPTKAINELSRLLQSTGDVEIRCGSNQVAFQLQMDQKNSAVLVTKLIEGNYPNFRQVIPAESKERITLVREELLQSLKRAEIMTSDKANSVKLTFGRNNLAITANSPDVGEARESLAINYRGPEMAIAFNPGFMMDPLKVLENDEVFLEVSDELSPAVMKINGPFLYVIMPMRTN